MAVPGLFFPSVTIGRHLLYSDRYLVFNICCADGRATRAVHCRFPCDQCRNGSILFASLVSAPVYISGLSGLDSHDASGKVDREVAWSIRQNVFGDRVTLSHGKSEGGRQHKYLPPSDSLIFKSPNTYTEEYRCEQQQHPCLRQNIAQTAAAQDEIQHSLHRPGGGKNFHGLLNARWE